MADEFNILQKFGRGIKDAGSAIYGAADRLVGGHLPMGPIQQDHNIPLKAYIEKRRIKSDVLDSLRADVEYYIRNGMEPELAVKLVLGNKRMDFEKILDPNTDYAKAIESGDTTSALGKNAHRTANIYKYFENASPKEYANMFKDYNVTDVDMVRDSFTMPDTGYSEEIEPQFIKPSLKHLPSPEFNKLGLVQNEAGEWVPGRTQPVGGYGAELSRINRANPNAGPEFGHPVSLRTGEAPVKNKKKTQTHYTGGVV
jgi:hypothetical protein